MKILALDTATEACSVSLDVDGRSIDRYVEIERGHAEQLLPMVDSVLAEGGISLSALDAIAFGRGPGGFTGVRLAASVAQGLAFGAQVGVVPVFNLAAVAQRVIEINPNLRRVLVANDARMKEVYSAWFDVGAGLTSGVESVGPAADVPVPSEQAVSPASSPPSAVAGVPRSHSSAVPECVKPSSPDSKPAENTVSTGPSSGRMQRIRSARASSPTSAVESSRNVSFHDPAAGCPAK